MELNASQFKELKDYTDKYRPVYEDPYKFVTRFPSCTTQYFTVRHAGQVVGILNEFDMRTILRQCIQNVPSSFCVTLYKRNNAGNMVFAGYSLRSQYCTELFRADLA